MRLALLMALMLAGCAATRADARQRATLLVDKGRNAEAVEVLEAHLAREPDAVAERRLLVRVHALMGQLGQAEAQAMELARRLGPKSPVPWIELGFAMEFAHRYDEALALYDRAAEVAPADPAGPLTGGMRAARWGELELAEPRLAEAVRRDSRSAKAWHALGLVRLKLGNFAGAQSAYQSGLAADPGALENRVGLATVALARGDARAALLHYDAIVAARPSFADAYLGRSYALLKIGRLDDARAALEEGARLGASPRAVNAQRRLLSQADRRDDRPVAPEMGSKPGRDVPASPGMEPVESAPPAPSEPAATDREPN